MLNFFTNKTTTVAQPQAETTAPAPATETQKKSFFSIFKSKTPVAIAQKHHENLTKMLKQIPSVQGILSADVYQRIKSEPVQDILKYSLDLNNKTLDEAIASPTFIKFKGFLNEKIITRLLSIGTGGMLARPSKEGGQEHAKRTLDYQLIKAMKEGVANALQAKSLTADDKETFLKAFVESAQTRLAEGTTTPEQIIEEVRQLQADPVLGEDAVQGSVSKKIEAVAAKAEETKQKAETSATLEAISGTFQRQDEKLLELDSLFKQLDSLKSKDDSSVEDSIAINQEIQSIVNRIKEIVAELDPDTKISASHILNPLSKNLSSARQKGEIKPNLEHDLDRAELELLKKTQEINQELVSKLKEGLKTRTITQRLYDSVIGSDVTKTIAKNTAVEQRISTLSKKVKKFEDAEIAKTTPRRTWGEFFKGMVPSFKGSPSLEARVSEAQREFTEFQSQESVQETLKGFQTLVIAMEKASKKKYMFSSSKEKAVKKAEADLEAYKTAHVETLSRYAELYRTKCELEAEFNAQADNEASEEEITA